MRGQHADDASTFVLPTHDAGRPLMTSAEITDMLDAEDVERVLRR